MSRGRSSLTEKVSKLVDLHERLEAQRIGESSHSIAAFMRSAGATAATKVLRGKSETRWINDGTTRVAIERLARERLRRLWPHLDEEKQVFVLGKLFPTDFRKNTPGGMYGPKQYFEVSGLVPPLASAEELAKALKGKSWSGVRPAIV